MDVQTIAQQVTDAVRATPELAQELVADPAGAVGRITGATGFDVTEVLQASLADFAASGLDLSFVDLSKLDLSQLDVSRLDIAQLQSAASALHIDMTRLDLAAVASKLLGSGSLGGLMGGLFGRR